MGLINLLISGGLLFSINLGKIIFKDDFSSKDPLEYWVASSNKDHGSFEISKPKYSPENSTYGIKTSNDAKFYAFSKKFDSPFKNAESDLYISFEVTFVENVDCAGGYMKLLPDIDPLKFDGSTEYNVMFGPDICGSDRKVHVILNHKGVNHQIKSSISVPYEELTHQYTLVLKSDKSLQVFIDGEQKENGTITTLFDILPPKTIPDETDTKPENWDDRETIDDPTDKKPEDWDVPKTIKDPEAKKPEDWDDENDGDWEAPEISNPEFKGEWKPKQITNPDYKGEWKQKEKLNPEYDENEVIAEYEFNYVGFDLWQVKSGTIFQNIIIASEESDIKEYQDNFKYFQNEQKKNKEQSQSKDTKPSDEPEDESVDETDESEESSDKDKDEL